MDVTNKNINISTTQKATSNDPTREEVLKRWYALAKVCQEECKGANLFARLPPMNECPLCVTPFSRSSSRITYLECCGNKVCSGCYHEEQDNVGKKVFDPVAGRHYEREGNCPFCRAPAHSLEEERKLIEARASHGDIIANDHLAETFLKDPALQMKGLHYCLQGIEMGSSESCFMLSRLFKDGGCDAIEVDPEKAKLFRLTGAVRGDIGARHECGTVEYDQGNHELGIQHWKVAAEAGMQPSLDALKHIYNNDRPGKEFISKEEMASIYRACHQAQKEVRTELRDKHREGEDVWKC